MHGYRDCVLYDRQCIECGECDRCDLNPDKLCDNCKKCLQTESDYMAIRIDGMLTPEESLDGEEDEAP
ncbi:MAG: hypothetical protein LBM74_03430 [Oscillospiraceae bacterium]|jgi:hypothetical protein|nr:hypothetical protein [Oscillospiraceae bacterium]